MFEYTGFIGSGRNLNKVVIGEIGPTHKSIAFKQGDFKKELAPTNAKIAYDEINGEKMVIMTYPA